jgi:hypothetical protein
MRRLSEILSLKGIVFYQTDRLSLDNYLYEPFQDSKEVFEEDRVFETRPFDLKKRLEPFSGSIFRFFLDGSRKTYKVGDIITPDNKFVPAVAGQIGAVCCGRSDAGKMAKYDLKRRNILMLYDSIQEDDFLAIKTALEAVHNKGIPLSIEKYSFDKMRDEAPTNAAIAALHKLMGDLEISLLTEIAFHKKVLSTDEMLVLDGSLQFLTQKFDPAIFYNVVGVSKSFNPNLTGILKGKKHIGVALSQLDFGERTPVYKYETSGARRNTIGAWYLRIREKKDVRNPLEGVIKIEKMALDEDKENGFESDLIDNISRSILAERIPTCHGKDPRWANHLYPIYLSEKVLKSSFISDAFFMNLF